MAEQTWISRVKREFAKSPLVSSVFFGFVLAALEKLVEVEFACPCDAEWNAPFTTLFFVFPAVLVFLLMINIQGCEYETWLEWGKKWLYSSVPAMVWLILLFLDGQYYVCYKTDWSGKFVFVTEAAPKKWCKPNDHRSPSEDELNTMRWYSRSQYIGMGFVITLTVLVGLYVIARIAKGNCNAELRNAE